MKKTNYILWCVIGGLVFLGGLVLIFNSVSFGMELLNIMITNVGHSFDAGEANVLLFSYIENVRVMGTGLLWFGGIMSTLFAIKLLYK